MRNLALILSLIFAWQSSVYASDNTKGNGMYSWTSVTLSVKDIDEALRLWVTTFGMEIVQRKDGPDSQLASLWDIQPKDIKHQALLNTPGRAHGMIHLIEFENPGKAVREGAQAFDECPKNLDIYVQDMPNRVKELKAAGHQFAQETFSEITAPDGTRFREIHMPTHDSINVVLLEVIGKQLPFTEQGYAGVGPLITIVADAVAEREFYQQIVGLNVLNDNILEGPEIERMIGLPPGSSLDVSIWGNEKDALGQVEIIDYRGVQGDNLYPKAVPMQRGILQITYETEDMQQLTSLLDKAEINWTDKGEHNTLQAVGHFIRLNSPAGLQIDVFERQH